MSAFDFGILGLYFLTLVILAIMGFHRYVMVWLYFKHKDRKAQPRPPARRAPPGHRPAAHLQRDVRARPAARVGRRDPLPEGPPRDPGPRRLDRRDDRDREPRRRALPRAGLRHPLPAPHGPDRLQGGRPRRGPAHRDRRVRPHLRRRLRGPPRRPREDPRPLLGPEGRHGAGPLGPHQPRLLAADRSAVDHARRPLHHGARGAQPRRPLLQLQRHGGRLAPRGRSRTPAAGSTTPSPRTSTSPTGRR